jgi:hypothetical protein
MRLTVRHHFDFGPDRAVVGDDLVRPDAWDALRTQTSGAFALAETGDEWERTADKHPELAARRIDEVPDRRAGGRLVLYGVGAATLECWLARHTPARERVVTDYSAATVERLASIFAGADCVRHDLLADSALAADLRLFHCTHNATPVDLGDLPGWDLEPKLTSSGA